MDYHTTELPRVDADTGRDEVLSLLDESGVMVLENYIPKYKIEGLQEEFEKMLSEGGRGVTEIDYGEGRGADVRRTWLKRSQFPHTKETFSEQFMREVSQYYFDREYLLNYSIYVVQDVPGQEHVAQDLHYDKVPTLKFFLYLEDTDEDNGAFTAVPGSHRFTQQREQRRDEENIPERERTREIPDALRQDQVVVDGKAGSMIVFHTDVLHRAGTVSDGNRKVMRGHCREKQFVSWMDRLLYFDR